MVQTVKNSPAMQETWFNSWFRKIHWRRDRIPTPIFLGLPGGSAGKESTCNVGCLVSIPGLGRFPWRRERLPTPVFWPGEFHGLYSPWGRKEVDTTEQLSPKKKGSLEEGTAENLQRGSGNRLGPGQVIWDSLAERAPTQP